MPEETMKYIHIPVHNRTKKDKTIRTIVVSKNQGIKALYSVERKIILTLLFSKDHGWTMKKAKTWKKEHMSSVESSLLAAGIEVQTIEEDLVDTDSLSEDYELTATFIPYGDITYEELINEGK